MYGTSFPPLKFLDVRLKLRVSYSGDEFLSPKRWEWIDNQVTS